MLEIEEISCGYQHKEIIRNFSASLCEGEIISLLGPNGVGKTTLFKTILGLLPLLSGKIRVDGEDTAKLSKIEFAKKIAYVPQSHSIPFAFRVIDVVLMGCTAHISMFASPKKKDRLIAESTLERLDMQQFRDYNFSELSGGERQMVLIARALAQQTNYIMLDEPTSNLDFGNQAKVLHQLKRIAAEGVGVLMTTHAPDHSFLCGGKAILINRNRSYLSGKAIDILTEDSLSNAYGIPIKISGGNDEEVRHCYPII